MARRTGAAVAVAALIAGCAVPPPSVELSARVQQYRADIARRLLAVGMSNDGQEPLVVTRLQLRAAGFAPVPAAAQDVDLEPGDRVDLRVSYGPVRCGRVSTPAADSAVARVRTRGGTEREVVLGLPPGNGLLERLRRRECAERALREAVDVRLSPAWRREGLTLVGALELERQAGDAQVEVVEPGGNILFTVRAAPPTRPLTVLPPGIPRRDTALVIRATRCDPHALAESKRSYAFPFFVALGAAEARMTTLTADEPLQRLLDRLALDTCRPGG